MRRKLENNLLNTYIHSSQLEAFSKSFWKVPAVRKRDMRDQNVIQSCLQIRISQSDKYEYLNWANMNISVRQLRISQADKYECLNQTNRICIWCWVMASQHNLSFRRQWNKCDSKSDERKETPFQANVNISFWKRNGAKSLFAPCDMILSTSL